MKKLAIGVACILVVTFSAVGAVPKISEPVLRDALAEKLKDADSAKLRKVEIFESKKEPGVYQICGEVNSKNSYGAYTGYTPFNGFYINEKKYYVIDVSVVSAAICEKSKNGQL